LRAVAAPQDNGAMVIFQRFNFGDLAEFNVLDLRQYRSNQACEMPDWRAGRVVDISACPDLNDPARTMLGPYQERWFQLNFARTGAVWTIIAHSLMMMGFDQIPGPARGAYTDNWGAYPAARRKILDQVKARKPANVVAIGGDIHSYFVGEVKDDDADPNSASLIAEFVCTSITSESYNTALFEALQAENPNIKYVNDRLRGYVLCDLDRTRWLSSLRVVDTVHTRDGDFRTLAQFAVENGKPGIQPAAT
jgi:alkaline phosphatase D